MSKQQYIKTLSKLAQGLDPITGKQLANDSVLNRHDVIRALNYATSLAGSKWSISDESMLLKYYYSDCSVEFISNELGHSKESIIQKLLELDLYEIKKVA